MRYRTQGQNWEVEVFDSPSDSIRSYLQNINTHFAYENFRRMRAALRDNGKTPDGFFLAQALHAYSKRGDDYVRDVQSIIQANREESPQ